MKSEHLIQYIVLRSYLQIADQNIYDDPEYIRQEALKMGANIINYSFTQQ